MGEGGDTGAGDWPFTKTGPAAAHTETTAATKAARKPMLAILRRVGAFSGRICSDQATLIAILERAPCTVTGIPSCVDGGAATLLFATLIR